MNRIRLFATLSWTVPGIALALEQRTFAAPGIRISFADITANLISYLAVSAILVATALFLVGALYLTGSIGKPERAESGKKLMKNALIGMGIVLASYTILRTVIFLIY